MENKDHTAAQDAVVRAGARVTERPETVWHATRPIQIGWTYALDDCEADIFCPGNATRWRMAHITAGSRESAEAYARLIATAPELLAFAEWVAGLASGQHADPWDVLKHIEETARALVAKATPSPTPTGD